MFLWGWFCNGIETLHILAWIAFKSSWKYFVHLISIKLSSNPCWLDSSIGRAVDRSPEGASSSPARVNFYTWLGQCKKSFSLHVSLRMVLYIIFSRQRSFSPRPLKRIQKCERHRRSTSPALPVANLPEFNNPLSSSLGLPQINIIPPSIDVEEARLLTAIRYLKANTIQLLLCKLCVFWHEGIKTVWNVVIYILPYKLMAAFWRQCLYFHTPEWVV